MPSNHLILCHPLLLPSIFPSIRVFSNESAFHIRQSKYWSFIFNISPSNEHPGLSSFRMDWFDLHSSQNMLSTFQLHTPESQWFDSVRSVSVKYYLARHSSSSRISLFSIYLKVCPIIIKTYSRTSLVSQWIIHLPRQGT